MRGSSREQRNSTLGPSPHLSPAYGGEECGRSAIRAPVTSRRGTVLVLAIWVILILSGLALVYARSMRVEMIAAGNRLSAEQAAAVGRGAEQYVLARVDAALGDAGEVTRAPAEAVAVGGGYFWILRPRQGDPANFEYGIVDEASKLNLNVADPIEMQKLPGMDQYVALAILDWRDEDLDVTNGGAESEYYQGLPVAYRSKDAPLETFEELRLVKGVTDGLLYGEDRNANGAADDLFANARGPARMTGTTATADRRGLAPFATVLTAERNTDVEGRQRVDVTAGGEGPQQPQPGGPQPQPPPGGAPPRMAQQVAQPVPGQPQPTPGQPGQPGQPDGAETALRQVLQEHLKTDRVEQILTAARPGRPYANVLDFAKKGGMTPDELDDVFDRLTHTDDKVLRGRVNVNTAPREVLLCLPGLGPDDATALINNRPYDGRGGCGWVLNALSPEAINQCGKMITGSSRQYSADIVSVSGDGRAFKRVRIVVDGRQSPPVIVQRKDLTSLGWPLSEDLRTRMRAGTRPTALFTEVRPQGSSGRR